MNYSQIKIRKVIGKFKIETGSDKIIEAVFLRSKMYAYKTEIEGGNSFLFEEACKLKGINKHITKKLEVEDLKMLFCIQEKQPITLIILLEVISMK